MSQSSLNANAFFKEIIEVKKIWSIRDRGGIPAPKNADGLRVMPFWSKQSRAKTVIKNVPEYASFKTFEISLNDFTEKWLLGLKKDNFLVGLNWSGSLATGYDFQPSEVQQIILNRT